MESSRSVEAMDQEPTDLSENPGKEQISFEQSSDLNLEDLGELVDSSSMKLDAVVAVECELDLDPASTTSAIFDALDVELVFRVYPEAEGRSDLDDDLESALEDSAVSESLELASEKGVDRFAQTIMDLTGWTLEQDDNTGEAQFYQVLTDGERSYHFANWRIYVTFSGVPGIAVVDWSPETLEQDVKRAKSIEIPENLNPEEMARVLKETFSAEQLQQIWDIVQK